jgi:CubicO group peptidase (beta-lactamase class C family)
MPIKIRRHLFGAVSTILLFCFCLSACGSDAYWPAKGWRSSTPEQQGMDSVQLARLFEHIQQDQIKIQAVLIIRNGYIVAEAYYPPFTADTTHDLASCQKSVVSAMVGIAIDKGYLQNVQQKMVDLFPQRTMANMDARKQSITLEHMLTMSPGLAWDEWRQNDTQNSSFLMGHSQDGLQFVLDRPVAEEPGTRWNYNTGLPNLLADVVQRTSKMGLADYAGKYLFDPLGATSVNWRIGNGEFAVAMTPRDMARFGYLYLKQGAWQGKPVISPDWIKASTANHIATGIGGSNYGYFWWEPPYGGFAAFGDGGQRIVVIPEQQLVIVLNAGLIYPDMEIVPEDLVSSYILPAVKSQDALPSNPQGDAQLAALIKSVTQPDPKPVSPLPDTARAVSGKTYILQPNSIGLQAVALTFTGQDASINLNFAGKPLEMALGLNALYRTTKIETAGPAYGWMAFRGSWTNATTFSVDLLMSGVSRRLVFNFTGSQLILHFLGSRGENEPIQGMVKE